MANPSNYRRNGSSVYPTVLSLNSPESGPIYRATRDMGPPSSLDYPPQPVEMDPSAHSRTLPSPSTSSLNSWEASLLQPHVFGEVPFGSSNTPKLQQIPMEGSQARSGPLHNWYDANDGPWVHLHKVLPETVKSSRSQSRHTSQRVSFDSEYRQSNPSDAGSSYPLGVPPSDSGYETRRSVATSNFSGEPDRDQDCHSLVGHVEQYQPFQGYSMHSRDGRTNHSWTPPSSQPSDTPALICSFADCHKALKTPSELKKHELRHTKPFLCQVPGCNRTEGFSTKNDLERHASSKHPDTISVKKFRCLVTNCKSKDKLWPRLDNFRSHLKRVHSLRKDDELDEMVRRGEYYERPELDFDLELSPMNHLETTDPYIKDSPPGLGNSPSVWKPTICDVTEPSQERAASRKPPMDVFDYKTPSPGERSPLSDEVQQATVKPLEVFPGGRFVLDSAHSAQAGSSDINNVSEHSKSFFQSNIHFGKVARQTPALVSAADAAITEVIKTALASKIPGSDTTERMHTRNVPSRERSKLGSHSSWPSTSTKLEISAHINSSAPSTDTELLAEKKAVEVLNLLRDSGYTISISKERTLTKPLLNPGSVASNKSQNQETCQKCRRFRGRPCELKKHMKRHFKPYGCTFDKCRKIFGSKNDWKRHENSQHFHLETWRCSLPSTHQSSSSLSAEMPTCAKVCYRRLSFLEHLKSSHVDFSKAVDEKEISKKVDECRIGRNCQARFWCGFCKKLVDLKGKGLDAWNERFDHIDDHFMGRGGEERKIEEWAPVNNLAKKIFEKESEDSSSGSSGGSSPDAETGTSLDNAIDLEPEISGGPKRRRVSDSDEELRPAKQTKRAEAVVYCCQCYMMHDPKLNATCSNCDDSHKFCGSCVKKVEYRSDL